MKKITTLFLLCTTLLLIFTGCQQKTQKSTDAVSATNEKIEKTVEPVSSANTEEENMSPYTAENKRYNLTLPKAEALAKELKDLIYWEYATEIDRDIQDSSSILTTLEYNNCLDNELKLHLYYYECDISDMDYANSNHYNVIVTFPEEKQLSHLSFSYNAKGLSSDYDYGDNNGWFDEDIESPISSQILEQEDWFQRQYTFFGETGLTLSREEAENFEVTNHFKEGEKEQILQRIEETIKEEYEKSKDIVVCVRDFLPGDTQLSGRVIDLNMTSETSIPLFWIQSTIYYSDEKMEHFDDVYWDTNYSTGYSGGPDYDPTVKQLKKWAREEKERVNVEKCILAYQIKDGEWIDLKNK